MDWPSYGTVYTKGNRYFVIEGRARNIYVDFPNQFISIFYNEPAWRDESYSYNYERQYEKVIELKKRYNGYLRDDKVDFFKFLIVRRKGYSHIRYGVQIRVDWEKFQGFLDNFSKSSGIPLDQKYQYLMNSRYPSLDVISKSITSSEAAIEKIQGEVKKRVQKEIDNIEKEINEVLSYLKKCRSKLRNNQVNRKLWKAFNVYPTTLLYLWEMKSILENIKYLIRRGTIPPCYREMRKLLENLTWSIFDDFLYINSEYYKQKNHLLEKIKLLRPFQNPNREWYNWYQQPPRTPRNFDKRKEELRDKILKYCKDSKLKYDKKYNLGKGEITVQIKRNMSYPLYIVLSGIELDETEKADESLPIFQLGNLEPLVFCALRNILQKLKGGRRVGKMDAEFLEETTSFIIGDKNKYIVSPFPSSKNVINYLEDIWPQNLQKKLAGFWNQYNFFVHSYPTSWQVYPFSSVLEFKIFENEARKFCNEIINLIEIYLENCH